MRTAIYKYEFGAADMVTIPTREIVKVLSFGKQNPKLGILTVWAIVKTGSEPDSGLIKLRIYGTGQPLPRSMTGFITTIQDGPTVWHLFKI